jgi:hypothetical protein
MTVLHFVDGNLLRIMRLGENARVIINVADNDKAALKACSHHIRVIGEIGQF